MDGFLDCFSGFARDFGNLPHQVGAEGKHHIRQTSDVIQKCATVFLNEAAIAKERFNSGPLVLGCDLRAHLKVRRMARRTTKWILAKNGGSSEYGNALSGAPLAVVRFLGTHSLGDKAGPFILPELLEAVRPDNGQTDDVGHAAVIAKEMLGPRGGDVAAGQAGVKCGDTWPFLDSVD